MIDLGIMGDTPVIPHGAITPKTNDSNNESQQKCGYFVETCAPTPPQTKVSAKQESRQESCHTPKTPVLHLHPYIFISPATSAGLNPTRLEALLSTHQLASKPAALASHGALAESQRKPNFVSPS
jgi:hypothetical protein